MARRLREPCAPAHVIEIAKKHFPCTCGEIYLSRNLTAPDCPYHAFEWEDFASELESCKAKETGAGERVDVKKLAEEKYPLLSTDEWKQDDCEDYHTYATRILSSRQGFISGYSSRLCEGYTKADMEKYGKKILKDIAQTFLDNKYRADTINDEIVFAAIGETMQNFPLPEVPAPLPPHQPVDKQVTKQ